MIITAGIAFALAAIGCMLAFPYLVFAVFGLWFCAFVCLYVWLDDAEKTA